MDEHECVIGMGDDVSDTSDMMADMGFMFDSEQAVVCKTLTFECQTDNNSWKIIKVELESVDDEPGAVQSGHYLWPASPALAQYLVDTYSFNDDAISVIELGAGCGLGGCIAMQLPKFETIVFTDHDPGTLELSRSNAERAFSSSKSRSSLHYRLLSWGDESESKKLLCDLHMDNHGVDLVIGSDLIYDEGVVKPLFKTVSMLLRPVGGKESNGKRMIMTQSFSYDESTERAIDAACNEFGLLRKLISSSLTEGGVKIQAFDAISSNIKTL